MTDSPIRVHVVESKENPVALCKGEEPIDMVKDANLSALTFYLCENCRRKVILG